MVSTTFSTEVGFAELHDDFVRLTAEICWCAVATVDEKQRPRTRVLHVMWEDGDGVPVGWVSTSRSSVKTAHLARNPFLSCSYWTPAHDAVFVDCQAFWVDAVERRRHVWDLVAAEARLRGFDPYAVWPGGSSDATFDVLRLEPWRIQVTLQDLARGEPIGSSRVWHAPHGREVIAP